LDVITASNVWKKYRLYHDKASTLKEKLLFRNRNYYEEKWVLKEINLSIEKGEAIGLIGENGSGKSTLLKLLTRIIYPNKGTIEVRGKVSSLLELGAGFHPDMTGMENIFINASIFGLNRPEIESNLEQIISFSGLGDYIDSAVRTYSSGMYMRLAFSVAINVQADILLIDEILAVGDSNFQAKCFDKLQQLVNEGITIVIVSHDLSSIERFCSKAVWLDDGEIQSSGNPYNVTQAYLEAMAEKRQENISAMQATILEPEPIETVSVPQEKKENSNSNINRFGSRDFELSNLKMLDENNKDKRVFKGGEKVTISFDYKKNNQEVDNPVIGIGIFRNDGINCYSTNTQIDKISKIETNHSGNVKLKIESLALIEGEYILDIAIVAHDGTPFDFIKDITRFSIFSEIKDVGITRLKHNWIIDEIIYYSEKELI
jgi:ABC-type polysaccharide/polyol phosphate transport system ATPase subunit